MGDKIYLSRLIKTVVSNIGNKMNNTMFIKHYNSLSIREEEIYELTNEYEGIKTLFFEYDSEIMQEPYAPFFNWIKQIYDEDFSQIMTAEEFIDNCNVYPLIRCVFVSAIKNGVCTRDDDIIISEIMEERERLYDSLAKVFSFVSQRQQIFMVLSKIHLANYSSIEWLFEIINENKDKSYGMLMIYNEAYVQPTYIQPLFKKFLNMVDVNNNYFDWDTVSTEKILEKQSGFEPNKNNFKEYIIKLNNMYYLHATKQAITYLEKINQRIERDKLRIDREDKYILHALYAMISISDEDYNTALLLAGNYIYNEEIETKYLYWFNYIYALAQVALLQPHMSRRSVETCRKLSHEMNDDYLLFKAEYLDCIIKNYNWSQMFLVDFSLLDVSDDFIEKLKKYRFENALAYVYAYSFENKPEFLERYVRGEEEIVYFNKSIEIGKRLDNTIFLRSAYMKNILLYSGAGYHDISNKFYERRLEIVKSEKGKIREAHIYNGMGFNCIIVEKYSQADEYFNKALEIYFYLKEIKNIPEALYNSATNSLVAGDYLNAYNCVDTTLYILDRLGMQSVQMCNASKLYGIAALSCYYLDEMYKCIGFLRKMEQMMNHILKADEPDYTNWEEDLCFYYLIRGLLDRENDIYESIESFTLAAEHQNNVKGNKFITYSFLAIETAKSYRLIDNESKAIEILEEAIQYSLQNGYSSKARLLISQLAGEKKISKMFSFGTGRIKYSDIKKLARSQGNKIRLDGREKDIDILSKWQETLKNNTNDINKLINNSMTSIISTFNMDGGLFIKFEDGNYNVKFHDEKNVYTTEVIEKIVNYFVNSPKIFLVNRTDKGFDFYNDILEIYGKNKIATLVGIPLTDNLVVNNIFLGYVNVHRNYTANKNLMTEDNLTMIRSAFEQIVLISSKKLREKELEYYNNQLKEISFRDTLTGLYNRQGFKHCIQMRSTENKQGEYILLYIDLDDFKSYNDLYGHAIGDQVLIRFAQVLRNYVANIGYGVRYGGDEFIAILHDTDIKKTQEIIRLIRKDIERGVTQILKDNYKGNMVIPENKAIECSIGIAEFDEYTDEGMSKALRQADTALYYTKNNDKGNTVIWKEMNHNNKS